MNRDELEPFQVLNFDCFSGGVQKYNISYHKKIKCRKKHVPIFVSSFSEKVIK